MKSSLVQAQITVVQPLPNGNTADITRRHVQGDTFLNFHFWDLHQPGGRASSLTHTFFFLCDHVLDTVPAEAVKCELPAAGRGENRISFQDAGYTARYLHSHLSGIGQAMIYIRPLQRGIDLEDSPTTLQQQGPLLKCLSCDTNIPLK